MSGSDPEPSVVNSLLIADRVYRDQESGKWVIAGVFSSVSALSFPTGIDEIDVFFQLTNASRAFDLHLRLEHADTGEVLLDVGGEMQLDPADPLKVIENLVRLKRVLFRRPGKYWVQLTSDEEILAQAPLMVRLLQLPESEEGRNGHA